MSSSAILNVPHAEEPRSRERLAEHQSGAFDGYTAARLPIALVWSESFERIEDMIAAERQIKGWSRAKKEALIAGRLDLLPDLSRRRS